MARSRYLIAAAMVALTAAGYVYWTRSAHDGEDAYVTEAVERGAIVSTVTATGAVNPVTTVQVGTYVSGPILAIDADFNSPVKKGQRVAKIDPAPFQVKVRKAEANLATARAKVEKDHADLALKKLTLDRNLELGGKNLISQHEVDTAKSNYDQAAAQRTLDAASVRQAEAELEEARINLAYTDITSPVDGVVVSRNVDVGQTVAASFQTPTLFLIAQDLTKMQVDTSVSESDIGGIRDGQPASFTVDAYPGKEFHGTVLQVRNAPTTVQNVVTYDVPVGVDNTDLALKPGMTATVTITTARRDDVLKIPVRALRFRPEARSATPAPAPPASHDGPHQGGGRARPSKVWVVPPDGELRPVEVQLGIRNDQEAELVSGDLRPGDRLAVAFQREPARAAERPRLPAGPRFR